MTEPVSQQSELGCFEVSWKQGEQSLVFTRQFESAPVAVPASEYDRVRQFFLRSRMAAEQPVVLIRSSPAPAASPN
ncbi:MAG: hypothetical protein FJW31_12905 [Acidobacteria bacterium]|nr:hypothetical protein [Acidobacteriota bacterium]